MSSRPPPNDNNPQEAKSTKPDPSNLSYKTGDILTAKEEYIVHQCNCTTSTSAGLAAAISSKFPNAAPYANRRPDPTRLSRCLPEDAAKPGTIQIWRSPEPETPNFIGLYAQYGPGKPSGEDSKGTREEWFRLCMELVAEVEGVKSIALPWRIGCGLAGGDWETYEGIITEWAKNHKDIQVVIYKLEEGKAVGSSGGGRGRGRAKAWSFH